MYLRKVARNIGSVN